MGESIARFQEALRSTKTKNIIVVAGAGLSAASGTYAIALTLESHNPNSQEFPRFAALVVCGGL